MIIFSWAVDRLAELVVWLDRRVHPDDLAAPPKEWQPAPVSDLSDLIPRWVRHASRMGRDDLAVATYVHVRMLEEQMADLKQVVDDLVRAVQGVIDRIGNSGGDLSQALADAKAANEQLQAAYDKQMSDDAIEDADFQSQIADLTAQRDAAQAKMEEASGAIVQATAQLDQLATSAATTPIPSEPPTPETPMGEPADTTGGEGTPTEPPADTSGDTTTEPAPEATTAAARRRSSSS